MMINVAEPIAPFTEHPTHPNIYFVPTWMQPPARLCTSCALRNTATMCAVTPCLGGNWLTTVEVAIIRLENHSPKD